MTVFALFDKLILMAYGEQVYYGSTHEAVKYFSSPSLDFQYSKGRNPAEFVMEASGGLTTTRGGLKRDAKELAQLFAASDLYLNFCSNLDTQIAMDANADRGTFQDTRIYPRDMYQLTKILNYRAFKKLQKYVSSAMGNLTSSFRHFG